MRQTKSKISLWHLPVNRWQVSQNVACIPIPIKYRDDFRPIQQLYREGRYADAVAARKAWVESMEAGRESNALTTRKTWAEPLEAGITLTRIERQLFLLNRNVERMLNANLRMVSLSVFV